MDNQLDQIQHSLSLLEDELTKLKNETKEAIQALNSRLSSVENKIERNQL